MNNEDEIEKILYYYLDQTTIAGTEEYSLLRAVMYKNKGQQGEEYFNGEWHPFDGALSYYPDPTPGQFIDEAKAQEIMKIIDREII